LLKKNLALDNFVSGDATTSFELSYQGLDNRLLFEEISSMYLDICPSLAWSAPHCIQSNRNLRSSSERIRIGFVSNFFHFHPVSNCFGDIIKCVSREKFEVFTISMTSSTRDNTFQDLHGHSDGTISVPNNLDKARKMIADARLDILIYPEIGMDSQTYLLAFSRLAPVQCVMSGHPDTTGIPNVDYFISNSYLEPKNADDHYSEKLIKLSSILVGDIKTHAPREDASRIDYGIPKEANVYICAQTPYKFHPEFDNILGEILRQDSEGILILFKGPVNKHSQLLYQRLSKTIPDVIDRVMLLDRVPYHEFSSILSVCDVALDTIHFNGGSTSVMAFAQGIPVVTMPTQFMRGRVTYGYYLQMGMTDCVAHTNEEYVEIAIRYARDGKLRAGMMEKIKKAYEVSLTSPQLPTLEFENFLEGTQNVSSKY
jgi:predicted O-linked N-acetylglucosamine transferase (SPINDLY family)